MAVAEADFGRTGRVRGTVRFYGREGGTVVRVALYGLEPEHTYAMHIHEKGFTGNDCMTAGAHYNPTHRQHPHHLGDMTKNIHSDRDGTVRSVFCVPKMAVDEIVGRTVVVHFLSDDLGSKGIIDPGTRSCTPYRTLEQPRLVRLCRERGYPTENLSRQRLVQKLETQSLLTGNAGGRMACALIRRKTATQK
ncbi:superoxide dismutase family protein [bacterium]|nr:superoxide dismutase family protein [bacterium]